MLKVNMTNSFFDIPRDKLITIFPEIIRSSEEHYKSAVDIANTGKPGTAISLLLISSEEMVKALIVVLDARGFQFRTTKGMDVFFKNHEIRFFIGWAAIVASMFGEDFIGWIKDIRENPNKIIQQKEDYLNNAPYIEKWLKWYLLR